MYLLFIVKDIGLDSGMAIIHFVEDILEEWHSGFGTSSLLQGKSLP